MMDEQRIWSELATITDPEIPVISLVEMRVIRSVAVNADEVRVIISPTFVGCPALEHMKDEIRAKLAALGCGSVVIETTYAPPWSTDMLDEATKEKLRSFGIAPPPHAGSEIIAALELPVVCPFCTSTTTTLDSAFGATLCKQLYYCNGCRESFERFKPI